jgi:hypothetical protein
MSGGGKAKPRRRFQRPRTANYSLKSSAYAPVTASESETLSSRVYNSAAPAANFNFRITNFRLTLASAPIGGSPLLLLLLLPPPPSPAEHPTASTQRLRDDRSACERKYFLCCDWSWSTLTHCSLTAVTHSALLFNDSAHLKEVLYGNFEDCKYFEALRLHRCQTSFLTWIILNAQMLYDPSLFKIL